MLISSGGELQMRRFGGLAAVVLLAATAAWAGRNDYRLQPLGNPTTRPDANANFRAFARELGAGITSIGMSPPQTLGHLGFAAELELSTVSFNTSAVQFPTQGGPHNPVLLPSLHVRKGLPFSFEVGARVAYLQDSRIFAPTLELKWAVTEGFPYVPDIGLRVHGTRLLNTRDFDLTTLGVDLGLGHRFVLSSSVTLAPYGGWNLVWVGASSNNIDFNPGRTEAQASSSPVAQLTDTGVYDSLTLSSNGHSRFYAGARLGLGMFQLGMELSYSNLGSIETTTGKRDLPSVFAFNTAVGVTF